MFYQIGKELFIINRWEEGFVSGEQFAGWKILQQFRSLDLNSASASDEGMQHVGKMTGLTWLNLADTNISDVGLSRLLGLTNLQVLVLDGTAITYEGLAQLGRLTKLRTLHLRRTKTTGKGIVALKKQLPKCGFFLDDATEQ